MTVLTIIIILVLTGMFWRQILKGGLISIIILLILSLIAYFFFSYSAIAEKQIKDNLQLSHMLRCETNYDSRYVALLLEKYNEDTFLHLRIKERVDGKLKYIKEHTDNNCLSNTHVIEHVYDAITYCNQTLTSTPDIKVENITALWLYDRNNDTLTDYLYKKEYKCNPWPLEDN